MRTEKIAAASTRRDTSFLAPALALLVLVTSLAPARASKSNNSGGGGNNTSGSSNSGGGNSGGGKSGGAISGGGNSGGGISGGGISGGGISGGGNSGGGNSGGGISGGGGGNGSALNSVPVPVPPDLATYVNNQAALIALGKALFWDMQVGNDGNQACATCHFHAGADHRDTNQLNGNGGPVTPNYTLSAPDFPFHSRQVSGSAGVFRRQFLDIVPGSAVDNGYSIFDSTYNVGGVAVRRVTGRNAPTVINAVFNVRNFWDGRAKDIFTVFTPFGDSDPNSNIVTETFGALRPIRARIQNSSLASQSVGPANNPVEMSSDGRDWRKLGKKMLSLMPLAKQRVHPQDSVLGPFASPFGPGLRPGVTYSMLIQQAFRPQYWNSIRLVDGNGNDLGVTGAPASTSQYSQMEYNFALFWGLAVQAYESTLVSGASPYDQLASGNRLALTPLQAQGLNIFQGKGQCQNCHTGPEFTSAAYTTVKRLGSVQGLSHGLQTDTGFFHTGVRPASEDNGVGNNDGFGHPLSIAMQLNPATAGVTGAFKTPTLRNTEFTGPFFHNGEAATLEQVIDFYSRGGDTPTDRNLGPGIQRLSLSATDKAALVAFLKALSDDRVRFERAPFDHPQLCVPNGEMAIVPGVLMSNPSADPRFMFEAADKMVEIQEVGAGGGLPLQTFGELIGADQAVGPRAHDLKQACTIR